MRNATFNFLPSSQGCSGAIFSCVLDVKGPCVYKYVQYSSSVLTRAKTNQDQRHQDQDEQDGNLFQFSCLESFTYLVFMTIAAAQSLVLQALVMTWFSWGSSTPLTAPKILWWDGARNVIVWNWNNLNKWKIY